MGKITISEYLKSQAPKFVFIEELVVELGINRASIYRTLKSLKKHDEIELRIIWDNAKKKTHWKTGYRLNPDKNEV